MAWISQRVGNILLRYIIAVDMLAEHSCCESPTLPHLKGALLNLDHVTGEDTELIVTFREAVRDDSLLK